ncbi:MAG: isochorismatase family protein [Clostridia bacterium]|jgi:nicotinamidase-related amidase|nr:cysteine hydrolase [Clostridia bacterium]MDD4276194.1 isochorismatase family protein [Clostridia bacterium]
MFSPSNVFPPHCIKGTTESELIPELKKYEKYFKIIEKNTTNGFNTKEFLKIAQSVTFDQVVVTGCCTDICVEQFVNAYSEFIKLNNKHTQIIIPQNAVYTFDFKP